MIRWNIDGWHLDQRPKDPPGEAEPRTKRGYRKMPSSIQVTGRDPLPAVKRLVRFLETFDEDERANMYRLAVERDQDANEILEAESPRDVRPRSGAAGEDESPETTEPASEAETHE